MAREEWLLVNLTKTTLSPGFLNMRTVEPGKKRDLLGGEATKDEVRQSDTIKKYIDLGYAKIERMIDNELIDTITEDNIHNLFDIPTDSPLQKSAPKNGKKEKKSAQNVEKIENYSLLKEGDNVVIEAKDKSGKSFKLILGKLS